MQVQKCLHHEIGIFAIGSSMGTVEDDIQLIRDLIEWSGETAAAIARSIGSANTTINRFKKGSATTRLGRQTLGKLKDAYPKFPGFADDDSASRTDDEDDEFDPDEVEIQQWDIAYGMGGGTYMDLPVTGDRHKFSRSWLRQFTHAPPQQIFLASGTGDSMTPTILDADIVVIDTSQREVRMADRIYAAAYGTTGIIKRLRPMPDGSVKILSDNPNVSPETAYDGELSVVGRVVAIVRKT